MTGHTMAVNQASRRVLEKAGLSFLHADHDDALPAIPGAGQGWAGYALTREERRAGGGGRRP